MTNVTLDFDTSEMGSTKLNVSNIRAINVPSNYELQILSSLVSGVTLYGPADEIEKLNADTQRSRGRACPARSLQETAL